MHLVMAPNGALSDLENQETKDWSQGVHNTLYILVVLKLLDRVEKHTKDIKNVSGPTKINHVNTNYTELCFR